MLGSDWRAYGHYALNERIPDGRRKCYPARILVDGQVWEAQMGQWDADGEPVYAPIPVQPPVASPRKTRARRRPAPLTRPKRPSSARSGIWTSDATVTYRRELERYIDYLEAQLARLTQPTPTPLAVPAPRQASTQNPGTQAPLWEDL